MDAILSALFLLLTGIAYIFVAWMASRGVTTTEDYILGQRSFGTFSITITLIATQLGAGMLFGTTAEAYTNGFLGISYILGMALGLIILGLGVAARLRRLEISTTAELFEKSFGSPFLRKIAAIISILTMGGILAAQILASRQLFSSLFELSQMWLVAFWLIIIAYTMFGGLKAIIATDILQVGIIVAVFGGVLFYVIPFDDVPKLIALGQISQGITFHDGFFATLIAPALFSIIEQDLAQRFFAAKDHRVATVSALLAAGFLIIFAIVPISFGIYAHMTGVTIGSNENPLVVLLQSSLPHFGMTMVACALLAAICSTADSLLGAASSNLIADFSLHSGKNSLFYSRLITFLVGSSALLLAFNFDGIISIIVKSYEISISALFIPLIMALFSKKPSRMGAFLAVFSGLLAFALVHVLDGSSSLIMPLMASGAAYAIGTICEPSRRRS